MEKATENTNQQSQSRAVADNAAQRKDGSDATQEFIDNRLEAAAQLRMAEMMNNSPQSRAAVQMKSMMQSSPHNAAQNRMANMIRGTAQLKENNTGMPDGLKSGLENLSGMSMDHVNVHYNSPEPAQLNAHAFTQGSDIHVASGQEKHLAHEGWHVVQQAQGRVQPTMQMAGTQINDDVGLEEEADVMGGQALSVGQRVVQRVEGGDGNNERSLSPITLADKCGESLSTDGSQAAQRIKLRADTGELAKDDQKQALIGNFDDKLLKSDGKFIGLLRGRASNEEIEVYLLTTYGTQLGRSAAAAKAVVQIARANLVTEGLSSASLSEAPDIKDEFVGLKACVITALLYAEGGQVFGVGSVEGIHRVLRRRYADTLGQYSDDNIIPHLYGIFGYRRVAGGKFKEIVADHAMGMVCTGKHAMGFKQKGDGCYFRDNEAAETKLDTHSKGNETVQDLYIK